MPFKQEEGRPGHDTRADRESRRRNQDLGAHNISARDVSQRTHREFVSMDTLMLVRVLAPDSGALIEFRERDSLSRFAKNRLFGAFQQDES
jgi:hypothetical protein